MATILIVDSERRVAHTLSEHLRRRGYITTVCADLTEAERYLTRCLPDLMILETRSSSNAGRTLLDQSKRARHIPTIAIGSAGDGVAVLDSGADDYLRKPFSLGEATARVRALFRRSHR